MNKTTQGLAGKEGAQPQKRRAVKQKESVKNAKKGEKDETKVNIEVIRKYVSKVQRSRDNVDICMHCSSMTKLHDSARDDHRVKSYVGGAHSFETVVCDA